MNSEDNAGSANNQTADSVPADQAASPSNETTSDSSIEAGVTVGWREWVALPDLGLPAIKAKVDTGARTSAIHAFDIERFQHDDGSDWVAFSVLPIQRDKSIVRRCQAPLVDTRSVTDSGGHSENRLFISTRVVIGELVREVEITLAQRNDMLFRMLLGRTTLVPDVTVNPALSYTLGRRDARVLYS